MNEKYGALLTRLEALGNRVAALEWKAQKHQRMEHTVLLDGEVVYKTPSAIKEFSTRELVMELQKREGVETHKAGPSACLTVKADGPVTVLCVVD